MIVIIIIVIGYGMMNFNLFKSNNSLLDVSINSNSYSYVAGENINYQVHISNMGSENRFDATIKYLILDDLSNTITRKEETIAVETTASINRNIQLPTNIKPGKYSLLTIVYYGRNQEAKTSFEFNVIKLTDVNTNKNNLTNSSTIIENKNTTIPLSNIDTGTNTINSNNNPQDITTDNVKSETFGDILVQIKENAKVNPQSTAKTCENLDSNSKKDMCYSTIADISQLPEYCDAIISSDNKDSCYLSFAMKGTVEVCDKIINNDSKSFCDQLKIVKLMDQYYKENNTEKILELSKQFNPEIYSATPVVKTYEYSYSEVTAGNIMDVITDVDNPEQNTTIETPTINDTTNITINDTSI